MIASTLLKPLGELFTFVRADVCGTFSAWARRVVAVELVSSSLSAAMCLPHPFLCVCFCLLSQ